MCYNACRGQWGFYRKNGRGYGMTGKEKAVSLFKEGYNCSQSVFAAYADRYGIDKEMALKLSA